MTASAQVVERERELWALLDEDAADLVGMSLDDAIQFVIDGRMTAIKLALALQTRINAALAIYAEAEHHPWSETAQLMRAALVGPVEPQEPK